MSTGRMIARAAVSAAASLALVMGAGTAPAAAAESTTAAQCAAEKQDVSQAKKNLKKKKRAVKKANKRVKKAKSTRTTADDKKAKKVKKKAVKKLKKAKKRLKRQKVQRAHWCDRAHDENAALTRLTQFVVVLEQIQASGGGDVLPNELQGPVTDAATKLIERLQVVQGLIPGAEPEVLSQLVTELHALDPTALQGALETLAAQFGAVPGSDVLADALMDGTVSGDLGQLGDVQTALENLAAQLQSFDPTTGGGLPLKGLEDALHSAAQQMQDSAPALEPVLAALTALNGGTLPGDPADLLDLLSALTTLNDGTLPTDPTVLTGLVTGLLAGEVPTDALPPEIGDVLDDAVGGLLPGVEDLLDPVTDPLTGGDNPLDPVTDVLDGVTDPVTDVLDGVTDPLTGGDSPLDPITDPVLGDGGLLGGLLRQA